MANKRTEPESGRSSRVLQAARHAHISRVLLERGHVVVTQVANELSVSEMTIRRDLADLEGKGSLVRTHGGAVPVGEGSSTEVSNLEPAFVERLQFNREAKERIAAEAAKLVEPYQSIVLGRSATLYLLVEHLASVPGIQFFTNNLQSASRACALGAKVFVPSGHVRDFAIGGPAVIQQFSGLWFDLAMFSAAGVTADGIYEYSIEDNELKRIYLRQSAKRILLCDSSKFDRKSVEKTAPLSDIDVLVTDAPPPAEIAAALKESDVEVHIVQNQPATARRSRQ